VPQKNKCLSHHVVKTKREVSPVEAFVNQQ